jgi:hypothetical protein
MNPVRIEWIMGLLGLAGRTSRPVRAGVVRFRLAMTHSQIPLDREPWDDSLGRLVGESSRYLHFPVGRLAPKVSGLP